MIPCVKPVGVIVRPLNYLHQNCLGVLCKNSDSWVLLQTCRIWSLGVGRQKAAPSNIYELLPIKKYLHICLLPGDLNILTNEKIVYLFITILIPAHIYIRHASLISPLHQQCLPAETCHVVSAQLLLGRWMLIIETRMPRFLVIEWLTL